MKQLSAWGVIGVFLFSWAGFFVFFGLSNNGALENQVGKHLEAVAFSKAERVGVFLDERKVDLEFLIESDEVVDLFRLGVLDSGLDKKLEFFREANGYLDLVLINISGEVLWSSADKDIIGMNLSHGVLSGSESGLESVFKKVQNDFGVGIFDPGYFEEGVDLSVFVTSPVLVRSESIEDAYNSMPSELGTEVPVLSGKMDMLGIVVLRIDNAEIEKRVVSDIGFKEGLVYLVNRDATPITGLIDEDGRQVTEVNSELVRDCFKDYHNYYFERSGESIEAVDSSGIYESYLGDEVFGAHQYILETGWCVLVEADRSILKMEGEWNGF